MSKVIDLYGIPTNSQGTDWAAITQAQYCPYLKRRCIKIRKSETDLTIGTCAVMHGAKPKPYIICPFRLLERSQVFMDCLGLLTLHEPGNELHILPEIQIPGGNVDYFLVSVKANKVKDFVGVELQTLDTTGTVWPERRRFLASKGVDSGGNKSDEDKKFGLNWKMTAKTILMQLHHKIETFESVNKHLVLAIQDVFLDYMRQTFSLEHLKTSRIGDPMHIYAYSLTESKEHVMRLEFQSRFSTDATGIAQALNRLPSPNVKLEEITALLEDKISDDTLFVPLTTTGV